MLFSRLEHLSYIIAASLLNDLDEKGRCELNEWLNGNRLNRDFYDKLQKSYQSGEALRELSSYDSIQDWVSVKRRAARYRRRTVYRISLYTAAAIAGLSALLSVLIRPFSDKESLDTFLSSTKAQDTSLVKDNYKALLILSTGNALDLGQKLELDGGKIKNDGTILEYKPQTEQQTVTEQIATHILKVPRGAEYKVVLADGSVVHLNADSELRYPEHFGTGDRTVELIGEAYFDIKHDPEKPFIVVNGDMKITVTGTSFNLKAYAGAGRQTTLAEGRVRIENEDGCIEINPGQQAYELDGELQVRDVRIGEHLGWLNKRLIYKSASLQTIALDITRYYGKEVVFSDQTAEKIRLTANIPRYENLEQVLDIISRAIYVNISIEGGLITIQGQDNGN